MGPTTREMGTKSGPPIKNSDKLEQEATGSPFCSEKPVAGVLGGGGGDLEFSPD